MKGSGVGTVYRATWIDHLPESADQDDGPNYRTAERDCRHSGECHCADTAEWFAKFHSERGPQPGYYEMRIYKIRKTRIQRAGRELIDDRDLELIGEWTAGEQLQLAV